MDGGLLQWLPCCQDSSSWHSGMASLSATMIKENGWAIDLPAYWFVMVSPACAATWWEVVCDIHAIRCSGGWGRLVRGSCSHAGLMGGPTLFMMFVCIASVANDCICTMTVPCNLCIWKHSTRDCRD